jgi:hypothetical protein
LRHVDIREDQSERSAFENFDRLRTVTGFLDLTQRQIRLPEHPLQYFPYGGGVIDD